MKILIVSDTHRQNKNVLSVIEKVKPIDLLVHCGDVEGAEDIIAEAAGCPVKMVQGNNDFWSNIPREQEFMIGDYKVWLTHGHNYYVSMNYEIIKQEAREREVDIVMFGHTHKPLISCSKDVTLLNPGSMTYPRQEGRKPSYMVMEIDAEGEAHYTVQYIS